MSSPPAAMGSSSPSASFSSTADCTATVPAEIVSPRTMMVNRPYRSAMWCGCQAVRWRRSATTGTASSPTTSTRNSHFFISSGAKSNAIHPTWQIVSPVA